MQTIHYSKNCTVPVIAETDVLVVGGGPGGISAAVTAARQTVRVILAERYGAPGGAAFFNEVTPFMSNHIHNATLDRPFYVDWNRKMWSYIHPDEPFDENVMQNIPISKEAAMLAAEDLLLEAGVRILYHHTFFDVIKTAEHITAVLFFSKSGLAAVTAKVVIDSTGDGDVAAQAGCPVEIGNQDGLCQPMTLCFKLSHIDKSRVPERTEISRLYDEAKTAGEIDCSRENVLMFPAANADAFHFNTTRVIRKSAINAVELSEAEIEGRRQMRAITDFMKRRVPGFEHAVLHSAAHHIGVRESRRIRGELYQTEADFVNARKFPDGIARCCYHIDIHNPSGSGTTLKRLPVGEWYEISFRTLKPLRCDNLLMGCRAISVDHALFSSIRIMPAVCSLGQAAGMGAALAVQKGITVHELDGLEVKAHLIAAGAALI